MRWTQMGLLVVVAAGLAAADPEPRLQAMRAAAAAARAAPPEAPVASPVLHAAGPFAISRVVIASPADAQAVPRYGRVELTVTVTGLTSTLPYDPDPGHGGVDLEATFTGSDGVSWQVPGYFDGSAWKVRFAPGRTGAWTVALAITDANAAVATADGPGFTCIASASHGWVRVSGSRLAYADGTDFVAVGHNNGWQGNVEQPSFTAMASQGERLLSFWLYQPWTADTSARAVAERVRSGVWGYNQATCAYVDGVVARAEAAGCFVLPSIWAHDELRDASHPWGAGNWTSSAYATICGTTTAENFFDRGGGSSEQWRRQQAWLRYLTARWGSSAAVIGWVGVVELEGTTGWVKQRGWVLDWCQAVRAWFIANDPYRSDGSTHPVAFSNQSGTGLAWQVGNAPADLRGYDSYAKQVDDLGVAAQMAGEVLALASAATPVVHTEFGGDVRPDTPGMAATQPKHLHNGTWADLAAGAALPGLLWCDDGHFPLLTDATVGSAMRDHLAWLSGFIAKLPWLGDADLVSTTDRDAAGARLRMMRTQADHGFAWFQRDDGGTIAAGQAVSVGAGASGLYQVWWYDPWSGSERDPVDVDADAGELALTVPAFAADRADVAVSWQARPAAAADAHWLVRVSSSRCLVLNGGRIRSLPVRGTLYQTSDGVTKGAAIASVPATVSDAGLRVIYVSDGTLGRDSFRIAALNGRAESIAAAAVAVTVTSDPIPGVDEGPVTIRFGDGSGCGGGAGAALMVLGTGLGIALRRRRY